MRIHLDTDFGGDTDDACALAYLLGSAKVELTGVTTVADADGRRAAYARYLVQLAGRPGVPVAAGAARSLTTGEQAEPEYGDWPDLPPAPEPPGAALDLLDRSIASGAAVLGIGAVHQPRRVRDAAPGPAARPHAHGRLRGPRRRPACRPGGRNTTSTTSGTAGRTRSCWPPARPWSPCRRR